MEGVEVGGACEGCLVLAPQGRHHPQLKGHALFFFDSAVGDDALEGATLAGPVSHFSCARKQL